MSKFRWASNLQLFADDGDADTGVEDAPAAGGQSQDENTDNQSGVEEQAAAEPNNFEKAFAKRLAAERAKWENEYAERYKDYETHKQISEFFQQSNNMDALTLMERIELERLQRQADEQNVPVEVMRRLQELEAKAAQAEQLAQAQQQAEWEKSYWASLNEYVKDRDVDAKAINQFLIESGIPVDPTNMQRAFDIAFKAVRHDQLERQLQDAEKNGMKKLLGAKGSIPTITNSTAQGQSAPTAPKTFAEARARAMARMSQTE